MRRRNARLLPDIDEPALTAQVLNAWFIGCVQRGDRAAAGDALRRLHAIAQQHCLVEAGFRAVIADAHLALGDGLVARAERTVSELLDTAARSELRNLFLFAGVLLYDVRRAGGRLAELLPWFESVHASGERIPRVPAMRIQALTAAGRDDEAATALTEMVSDRRSGRPRRTTPLDRHTRRCRRRPRRQRRCGRDSSRTRAVAGTDRLRRCQRPLEPVDDFIARLDAQTAPVTR